MFGGIKEIFDKRRMIFELAKADFKKRFVGSYFGVFWMFMQPIVTVVIYFFVFQLGFKTNPPVGTNAPYVLWLVPGIVPWFFINEAIAMTTSVLYEYNYLVKKVVFRISILPLIKMLSCLILHFIFLYITICVFFLYGYSPRVNWLQLLYYVICTFVLCLGISYATSAINVFFKDMAQIVNICLQFGMWIVPIMWPYTMFDDTAFANYVWVLKLNPVFYLVEGYRDAFLNNTWFWDKPYLTLYYWAVTIIIFVIGAMIFKRLKPHFSDVL